MIYTNNEYTGPNVENNNYHRGANEKTKDVLVWLPWVTSRHHDGAINLNNYKHSRVLENSFRKMLQGILSKSQFLLFHKSNKKYIWIFTIKLRKKV
jgi:hypothetical protein